MYHFTLINKLHKDWMCYSVRKEEKMEIREMLKIPALNDVFHTCSELYFNKGLFYNRLLIASIAVAILYKLFILVLGRTAIV